MAKNQQEEPTNGVETAAAPNIGAMGFGDISMIRNILMGQHITQFEEKFKQVDSRQDKDLSDLQAALRSLEATTSQKFNDLEKRVEDRFALLDAMTNDRFAKLNQRLDDTSRADKHALGHLLADLSAKLLEK